MPSCRGVKQYLENCPTSPNLSVNEAPIGTGIWCVQSAERGEVFNNERVRWTDKFLAETCKVAPYQARYVLGLKTKQRQVLHPFYGFLVRGATHGITNCPFFEEAVVPTHRKKHRLSQRGEARAITLIGKPCVENSENDK